MSANHNLEFQSVRQQKRCIECGKKARTIFQPNDHDPHSRTAAYRIICARCNMTFLVHSSSIKHVLKEYQPFE